MFRATRKDDQTVHALKVVKKTFSIAKLASEIEMSMRVDHPGLVRVSTVLETQDNLGCVLADACPSALLALSAPCWQISLPLHSLQLLRRRPCWQMLLPPHSLH